MEDGGLSQAQKRQLDLDGHVVLSRRLAERGRYPAIDVLGSISRSMPRVSDQDQLQRVARLREWLAHYEEHRDLVTVGAYRKGGDPLLDQAMAKMPKIEQLLFHGSEVWSRDDTLQRMQQLTGL